VSLLSLSYCALVVFSVALCLVLPQRSRPAVLCLCSLLFYAWGSLAHACLVVCCGLVVFGIGELLFAKRNRWLFALGIGLCVGLLCFYKYSVLFLSTLGDLFPSGVASTFLTHRADSLAASIHIPLGISFFTFEFVHYLTDVYKRNITRPHPLPTLGKRMLDFLLFFLFFPTLLAGPIKRYQAFSPDLLTNRQEQLAQGLWRILLGLLKKVLIADSLAVFASRLGTPELVTAKGLWFAMYAYAGQIYADFSGYSDVAIGVSLLLGYRIPENFQWPYLATSLSEFWRRWHISLSSWIRDYLFIPLGGSHVPRVRAVFNLLLVMGLCGLWHGPAGHFVVWGLWQGVGLGIEHRARKRRTPATRKISGLRSLLGWFWTFHFVCFGWILFAAPSLKAALCAIQRMFGGS